MDEIVVSTVVYAPAREVYDVLVDFPGYTAYSDHLRDVTRRGDGGPGTRYALRFEWWKLTYTARSEVTDLDPPHRIDWRLVKDIDAAGRWRIDPLDAMPADAPEDAAVACRVFFEVEFDPGSADSSAVSLPALVSFDWVLSKVKPLAVSEAEDVVERAVADIEGRSRPIELRVHERPGSV